MFNDNSFRNQIRLIRECPHRLLDLIVKERDSLSCRGMRSLRIPRCQSSIFCLAFNVAGHLVRR